MTLPLARQPAQIDRPVRVIGRRLALVLGLLAAPWSLAGTQLKVATFNVSMEAGNYLGSQNPVGGQNHAGGQPAGPQVLAAQLASGDQPQIRNIAAIVQQVRPDVLLLNEFDYIESPSQGVRAFIDNYLKVGQQGRAPIDYPYHYLAPVNTGVATPYDLDRDGRATGSRGDAQGYGLFPGHYGMLLLSKYPIAEDSVRSFGNFLWRDMPGALRPRDPATGGDWFGEAAWNSLRLSSKSHWVVPLLVEGQCLYLLASHPTPPVFDGEEDRNGRRNHDEIRLWLDLLSRRGDYLYDDQGRRGGLPERARFVLLGDLNASPVEGDGRHEAIAALLAHPSVNAGFVPVSEGGRLHQPGNPEAASHTASWGMRSDYVLPSAHGLRVLDGGVFWPAATEADHALVASRATSSDHRLVWLALELL